MKLKPGVKIACVRPEAVLGMVIVESVFRGMGAELVITSVRDGQHSECSLHPKGFAFDFRTRTLTLNMVEELVQQCKERLPEDFQVVVEKDHVHVEFDPVSF